MTHDPTSDPANSAREPELIEHALRAAGRRPQPSKEGSMRAYEYTKETWQRTLRQRKQRRRSRGIAVLLAACVLLAVIGYAVRPVVPAPEMAAIVVRTQGDSTYVAKQGDPSVREHDAVASGTLIETAADARLALQLFTGHSLRLDHGTRLALVGPAEFRLERGRIYVDSGVRATAQSLRIETPIATVRDVGTQFQVAWREHALRVHVREGVVALHAPDAHDSERVATGEILSLSEAHGVERTHGAAYGPSWAWVADVAPSLDPQERRLEHVLMWVCRELGYRLRYADTRTKEAVAQVMLDGSLQGLSPEQTLEVLKNITTFRYQQSGGELILESMHGAG